MTVCPRSAPAKVEMLREERIQVIEEEILEEQKSQRSQKSPKGECPLPAPCYSRALPRRACWGTAVAFVARHLAPALGSTSPLSLLPALCLACHTLSRLAAEREHQRAHLQLRRDWGPGGLPPLLLPLPSSLIARCSRGDGKGTRKTEIMGIIRQMPRVREQRESLGAWG